jgi:hypothetical protein
MNANKRGSNNRMPGVLGARKIDYSIGSIQLLSNDIASPG